MDIIRSEAAISGPASKKRQLTHGSKAGQHQRAKGEDDSSEDEDSSEEVDEQDQESEDEEDDELEPTPGTSRGSWVSEANAKRSSTRSNGKVRSGKGEVYLGARSIHVEHNRTERVPGGEETTAESQLANTIRTCA